MYVSIFPMEVIKKKIPPDKCVKLKRLYMGFDERKPNFVICKQQRLRPAWRSLICAFVIFSLKCHILQHAKSEYSSLSL